MRRAGRRTEGLTSHRYPNLSTKAEGRTATLPFVSSADQLSRYIALSEESKKVIEAASGRFPLKIPEFYLKLAEGADTACALLRQCVPSGEEIEATGCDDPLDEHQFSVTPSFIKKYPGRGVFLAAAQCALYCRFCNRRRFVGKGWNPSATWEESFRSMETDGDLKEVIVSGGDPFTLSAEGFSYVMERLKRIKRLTTIRMSTRLPVVYPEGLRSGHVQALAKGSPVWVVIHINHPGEVSPAFVDAVKKLRDAGSTMVSQTVLLRGVNDCPHILLRLFETLVSLGIKPYYLFQLDEVTGAMHFKVHVTEGIRIMHFLREHGSGLAIPQYALDITGGLGKVPLDYQYVKKRDGTVLHVESPSGKNGMYADNGGESACQNCGVCGQQKAAGRKQRGQAFNPSATSPFYE